MFKMLKFNSTPLDLLKVESGDLTKYCMLSCMLGLVADIDHDSDSLRSWGAIRFDMYAVIKIIRKRKYQFKLECCKKATCHGFSFQCIEYDISQLTLGI